MTDTTDQVRPVRRGEEEASFKTVETFARKRARAARRNTGLLATCLVISLAANLAQAIDEARRGPPEVQTVFFGIMEDGTVDTALSYRDLSQTEREAVLKDMAWTYVRACEEYSYAHAKQNFDLCKAMSDEPVKEAFIAKWFLPNNKDAPESPQKAFGEKGQIDLQRITAPVFVRDHVIQVRYKRIAWKYEEPRPSSVVCKAPKGGNPFDTGCTTWTATVDFTLLDKMPNGSVVGDAIKFFVMRYQVGEGAV